MSRVLLTLLAGLTDGPRFVGESLIDSDGRQHGRFPEAQGVRRPAPLGII